MIELIKRSKWTKIFTIILITNFISITFSPNLVRVDGAQTLAYLVFKTEGGGVRPDYGLYIAQYLRALGIEIEVKLEEWSIFIGTLLITHDYDLGIVGLSGGGFSPDMRDLYTEDGDLNMFLLGQDLPYGNQSEQMQNLAVTITDLEERQQLYYDWEQLMMDRIVPMLPLFSPNSYCGTWSNTLGFDSRWGIVESLPYMYYDGYHDGQVSLNELNLADANWRELNPLFTDDSSSEFIWQLMSEKLLHYSPEFQPLNTGIIQSWSKIDDFHYKFTVRNNVYWNPSYNTTLRTANSIPLSEIEDEELMLGLKNSEFSNGTNQKVTAKDVVFTLLSWGNDRVSENTVFYEWISDCYVDPINPQVFHILIDGNPDTPQRENYVDFWCRLSIELLPEFFLNSSSIETSYTAGGAECTGLYNGIQNTPQWIAFSTSAFGCGKYMLDYAVDNSVTALRASPYWYGIGAIDGTPQDLDIQTINIRVIPDISAELAEFKAGKLDWTRLSCFPAERKIMQHDSRFTVYKTLSNSFTFMFFNLRRPFIGGAWNFEFLENKDKKVYTKGAAIRKAICYAINRDEMNQVLHDGEYTVANSVIYPFNSFYYYDDIIKYDFNLELAQEWLRIALGLIDYSLDILILGGFTSELVVRFDVLDEQLVSNAIVYYNINNEGYNSSKMTKQTTISFSYSLGSGFTNGTLIKYYVEYERVNGNIGRTGTEVYYVNYDDIFSNNHMKLDAPSLVILSTGLLSLCCIFYISKRKRTKRNRIN